MLNFYESNIHKWFNLKDWRIHREFPMESDIPINYNMRILGSASEMVKVNLYDIDTGYIIILQHLKN